MNLSALVTSGIRTGVPMLVGFILSWLAARGFDIDETSVAGVVSFLTALFGWLYYLLARVIEMKFPKFGWLLGSSVQPKYVNVKK
jgi:hypothetical protein